MAVNISLVFIRNSPPFLFSFFFIIYYKLITNDRKVIFYILTMDFCLKETWMDGWMDGIAYK